MAISSRRHAAAGRRAPRLWRKLCGAGRRGCADARIVAKWSGCGVSRRAPVRRAGRAPSGNLALRGAGRLASRRDVGNVPVPSTGSPDPFEPASSPLMGWSALPRKGRHCRPHSLTKRIQCVRSPSGPLLTVLISASRTSTSSGSTLDLFQHLDRYRAVGDHPLQLAVLGLELARPLHVSRLQFSEPPTPDIHCLLAQLVFLGDVRDRILIDLAQGGHHLFFGESDFLRQLLASSAGVMFSGYDWIERFRQVRTCTTVAIHGPAPRMALKKGFTFVPVRRDGAAVIGRMWFPVRASAHRCPKLPFQESDG